MKNAGMHRLAPFMFGLCHVFLAVFSRHLLSTASPRPLQAKSRAGSFPVHFRARLLCASEKGRFVSGSFLQKLPHAGDELRLGLAVRGHGFTGYFVQLTS